MGFKESRHTVCEPALQLNLAFEALLPHFPLTKRAGLPVILGRFVSAQMDLLAWKQFHHFHEDCLQRRVGFLFSGAERIRINPAACFHRNRLPVAGIFRVGGKQGRCMARHLNFRNDCDVPLRAEGDDLTDIAFGIVATVRAVLH